MKIKIKKSSLFVFVILLALAGYLTYDFAFSGRGLEKVEYVKFYDFVEAEKVATAKITENKIEFSLREEGLSEVEGESSGPGGKSLFDKNTGGGKSKSFITENPHSPLLEEFLLKNGVAVQVEKSGTEILSLIFDLIFYAFFFGVVFVAFRKFISPNTFKVQHKTGVRFDDVVGMDVLKQDMKQVMDIMKNPAAYAKRGIRMPKGILLEGEPGNGKTLFAKALAGEAKVNFIPAKATDFESMFMAIGPMKVKLLFKKARRRAPCIVFIDEFDGIGTVRNYSGSAIETENTRIVTALLNELDGFERTDGVLVLAATNSVKALDPALIRPGRFDAKFTVPYPDTAARQRLVEMYSRGKTFAAECTVERLAKDFEGFSCAKIESVLNKAALVAAQAEHEAITQRDVEEALGQV